MLHDEQIDELIEEMLDSGRTPEEVCADQPHLLAEVQARYRRLKEVEGQLDSIFIADKTPAETVDQAVRDAEATLPVVPGYEVVSILGRGGMGIVYKARHRSLKRDVALKMLLTGSFAGRQESLRFAREAESVAALRHPNIVQIYDFGEVDHHLFFTMEYVGGGTLADHLSGDVQSARDAAKMVCALAEAVEAAHATGIVHRDLKPANILITEDGVPKISDFGLARRMDQESGLTHTGARLGTPSYMAPEQMTGSSIAFGPAVDIFALGAILYEMLTGRPPFRGSSLSDTERRLMSEEAVPPSQHNPKIPRDLETICLKCLEKEPRNRYRSAGELAADLQRFLHHEPIHARPVTLAERSVRWVRRNPLPAALLATSTVLLALIASLAMEQWREAAAARAERARLTSRFESGVQLVQSGRFPEGRAILGKLGDGGFHDLRERIDRALSDLQLVENLEAVSIKRAMALSEHDATWRPNAQAATEYEKLLKQAGIGDTADDPAAVAKRIQASDIESLLIATLDDWAVCETDDARRHWVLEVARQAVDQTTEWDASSRDPATWSDREALARLAETAFTANPSVEQLRALADRLAGAGLDRKAFVGRMQEAHVDSFLANLALADDLRETDPAEAVRYYQAALAIRPNSPTVHNNLAVTLASMGRSAEAIAHFERSLKLAPDSPVVCFNLGRALAVDRPDEAIRLLQRAVQLNARLAIAHRTLAEQYLKAERFDQAEASLKHCLELASDEAKREEIATLIRQCRNDRGAEPSAP